MNMSSQKHREAEFESKVEGVTVDKLSKQAARECLKGTKATEPREPSCDEESPILGISCLAVLASRLVQLQSPETTAA
jgi:hypothetical protein